MENKGVLFPEELQAWIRGEFCYIDEDPHYGQRLFFDNSGGSLRLKRSVEAKAMAEQFPDCPERTHTRAKDLKKQVTDVSRDILEIVFRAKGGSLITELTASQAMFHMVGVIMENTRGTNAVVSSVEHPSAFDAVAYYCKKTGKELRVIPVNQKTGQIEPQTAAELVDENTCLLSVMAASNVTGCIMDLGGIVRAARSKNPELYVISDAVQHAPHAQLEAEKLGIDGMNFAPYKFFGVRGCGFAYVSERVAKLPHHKLLAKEPAVFELGTSAPGNFAAMDAVIRYVCRIGSYFTDAAETDRLYKAGMNGIHLHERALLHMMLEGTENVPGLRHIDGVTVHVDTADLTQRDLITAIKVQGLSYEDCVAQYANHGVIVCDRVKTSMYAQRILDALGIDGAVRVSPMHCHGKEDIEKFLRITQKIAAAAREN